jgi:hypothetical protein
LCVKQQHGAGGTVGQRLRVAGEKFFQPCQALLLGERPGGFGSPVIDEHGGVDLAFLGPDEEGGIELCVVGPEARYSSTWVEVVAVR